MCDSSLNMFLGRIVVKIQETQEILEFDDGGFLTIECPWRLRNKETILQGSPEYENESKQTILSNLSKYLVNKKIQKIELVSQFSDLKIKFDSDLSLELFSISTEFENWTLSNGKGFQHISGKAGDLILING